MLPLTIVDIPGIKVAGKVKGPLRRHTEFCSDIDCGGRIIQQVGLQCKSLRVSSICCGKNDCQDNQDFALHIKLKLVC